MDSLNSGCMLASRNLATKMLVAMLLVVVKNVEKKFLIQFTMECYTAIKM